MENRTKSKISDHFLAFEMFIEERKQLLERMPLRTAVNAVTVCGNVVVLDAWRQQSRIGQEDHL